MAGTAKPLPKLHVYGSIGERYTEGAPERLAGIASEIDRIRSPVHVFYDGKKLYIGTRVNTSALGPGTERSERYAFFTEHDPGATSVKDAVIRHFEAIGQFNESPGNYAFNQKARAGAKLKGAYFDLANATHGNLAYVGITDGAPFDSARLGEFIESLRKPSQAGVPAEAVKKILDAPKSDTVHASLKISSAAEMVGALAQLAQAHIRQRPGEPFEAAIPRMLMGPGRPHKTVNINPELVLSAIGSIARIGLETGESVAPKPREPPAPAKKTGFLGRLLGR
jgi:hypothetical protein